MHSSLPVFAHHGSTAAASFPDLSSTSPYFGSISHLKERGIVRGDEKGNVNPEAILNRAELVVIAARTGKIVILTTDRNCMKDIKDEWFAAAICAAIRLGYIKGYPDGLFRPEREVTVGEAAKILANILAGRQFQELEEALAWLEQNGFYLQRMDLNAPIRRSEAFERLYRILTSTEMDPLMLDQVDSEGNPFNPEIDPIKNQIGSGQPTYVEFSQTSYDHFLGQSPMILFFHAPWCPLCRKSDEVLLEIFDGLEGGVIWFKVDYDTETALKQQYGITYQDTFVILSSSVEVALKGSNLGSYPDRAQQWMNLALGQ